MNDTLQSALILGEGSRVPDGAGGDEAGLYDGSEVHHHSPWWRELLQQLQEEDPLLGFFNELRIDLSLQLN